MADTLDTFQAITAAAATDLLHVKSGTGANTDKKITFANFESSLNLVNLTGYVANEHTDWGSTTRSLVTSGDISVGADVGGHLNANAANAALHIQPTADTQFGRMYFRNIAGGVRGGMEYQASTEKLGLVAGGQVRATIDSAFNFKVISGNLEIGTAGKGVDFTTNGGTILDQHKRGTFTGTLSGAGAGGTPVTATGYYTETGDKMHAEIYFQNISTASMTGELEITGMPKAAARRAVGIAWLKGVTATEVGQNPVIDPGTTRVYLMLSGSTATQNISAGANRYCRFSIDYLV